MVKLIDILFWLLILAAIAIAIWILSGSPDLTGGLISVMVFVAASEVLLWKSLFSIDKKNAIGFEKVRYEFKNMRSTIIKIESSLERIEQKLKTK